MISDGEIASSTRIRALLLAGDVEGASALLGRPFRVQGPLEHRWEAGRLVPAPVLHDQICPRPGAYRVQVEFDGEPPGDGLALGRLARGVAAIDHSDIDGFTHVRAKHTSLDMLPRPAKPRVWKEGVELISFRCRQRYTKK